MLDADRLFLTLAGAAALGACGSQEAGNNVVAANDSVAPTVEALPPDESVDPSADHPANDAAASAAADANNSANGY